MRISKALAQAGIASRRKSEEHVLNGAVTVNGEVVRDLGRQVDVEKDAILFRGRMLCFNKFVYFMLNKPKNYVTTAKDPKAKKTVFELLPRNLMKSSRQPSNKRTRVFSVGRLDRDSTGLLLFTNDGELANRLMHPRYQVGKWYEVRLNRPFELQDKPRILSGVRLSEGLAKAERVLVRTKRGLSVLLNEGKNREIRRIFDVLDYKVTRLCRRTLGPLDLGSLPVGCGRFLNDAEVRALRRETGL